MAKFGFWEDTFEQLAELGKTTAKQTGKAVKQIVDPTKMAESILGSDKGDKGMEQLEKGMSSKQNHTKLDFQKLHKKYQNQDKSKTDALRQHLFQIVKSGEEKILMEKRQQEMEKKRKESYEEMEKKRKEQEKKQQEANQLTPQGKIRRSIFSPKKVAKREQAEVRPSTGKQ